MSVLGVQTNQAFYLANSNANKANASYNQALDRLSSGLRINNAKDDAAGLAIAETMEKDIRGLGQANRNANDGISALQIMEGGLSETLGVLNRMSELAIQSKSGTYTDTDRAKMNVEFTALHAEIDRIAGNTKFNGTSLLNSAATTNIQVGTATTDVLAINTFDITTAATGLDIDLVDAVTAGDSENVSTALLAAKAMTKLDTAIGSITTSLATVGAQQSRLDSVISNNTVMKDATSLAKGRIMDADFAVESAALAKSNVLLQVSQSMIAQANQQPSMVLGLIR
jgi:flagellin